MRKSVLNALLLVVVVALVGLAGCGGGDAPAAPNASLKSVSWYYENSAPDNSNNGATCFLTPSLYYSDTLATTDIDSFTVTSQSGWRWNVTTPNFGTYNGKPYLGGRLYYGANPQTMPLAGTWTVELKLKNGATSSAQLTLHEPGSSLAATHPYIYSKEDVTPIDMSQYVAALARFPSGGYTVHYSPANGGSITTSGLAAVRASYLAGEPNAYNLTCWLYDANNIYLGRSSTAYSTVDHSNTNLITAEGELSIVPALTASTTGIIPLENVKYLRFVYSDGAQFVPSTYGSFDNRSISALVAVN